MPKKEQLSMGFVAPEVASEKKELNALLEIGTEEIPARFMPGLLADLAEKTKEKLTEKRLNFLKVKTLGTPRRLTLFIAGLSNRQQDLTEEIKGPPLERAFEKEGAPTKAAEGFSKKYGLTPESLTIKEVEGAKYVFLNVFQKGEYTEKILKDLFPEIIKSLYLPVAMRWGAEKFKFVRPIHWILALFGQTPIHFELAGIKAGIKTYGHRFLGNSLKIESADLAEYENRILQEKVILDPEKRKQKIIDEAKRLDQNVVLDKSLVLELTHLTEYPEALLGSFQKEYLSIPQPIIETVLKKTQKYLPTKLPDQRLKNKFIAITNGITSDEIRKGNEKVLTARLEDGAFFFKEDQKVPLHERIPALKKITFHEKLGSIFDRVERIKEIASFLSQELLLKKEALETVLKIAELSKADLTTQMVGEHPSLAGLMGREYALLSGENELVANGIYEHYLPITSASQIPKSIEASLVALADKIELVGSIFSMGAMPTGSSDPYGLRRQATGIVEIIIGHDLDIFLKETFAKLFSILIHSKNSQGIAIDTHKTRDEIMGFMAARIKYKLLEEKIPPDLIEASLTNFNNILNVYKKAYALKKSSENEWFESLTKTAERVANISSNSTGTTVSEGYFKEEIEKTLFEDYLKIKELVEEEIDRKNYTGALNHLRRLIRPVDNFFQSVMVMDKDEKLKNNRLALLKNISDLFLVVADFSKINI